MLCSSEQTWCGLPCFISWTFYISSDCWSVDNLDFEGYLSCSGLIPIKLFITFLQFAPRCRSLLLTAPMISAIQGNDFPLSFTSLLGHTPALAIHKVKLLKGLIRSSLYDISRLNSPNSCCVMCSGFHMPVFCHKRSGGRRKFVFHAQGLKKATAARL